MNSNETSRIYLYKSVLMFFNVDLVLYAVLCSISKQLKTFSWTFTLLKKQIYFSHFIAKASIILCVYEWKYPSKKKFNEYKYNREMRTFLIRLRQNARTVTLVQKKTDETNNRANKWFVESV